MLTDTKIRTAKPGDKPVRLYDERGLYLEVTPNGGRWWRLKYRHEGKEKLVSMGHLSRCQSEGRSREERPGPSTAGSGRRSQRGTSLRESRQDAGGDQQLRGGGARVARDDSRAASEPGSCGPHSHSSRAGRLSAARSRPDRRDQSAAIAGSDASNRGTRGDRDGTCIAGLRPGVSLRDRNRQGRKGSTPDLRGAPKPVLVRHIPAITDPQRVGELLRAIESYKGMPITRAAFQLAPLVFVRPGELRKAEWAKFDLERAQWRIPAARMKRIKQEKLSGAPRVVPLSRQALSIMRDLHPLTGLGRYVFPSSRTGERPISDNAVLSALRRMGFPSDEMIGHGFRAMARTLLAERLAMDEAVIEAQLAHAVKDPLGRAYTRLSPPAAAQDASNLG